MPHDDACFDDLAELSARLLCAARSKHLEVVTVESCTGGLLASVLTDVEGLSHIFNRGLVTYSEAAKTDLVGVSPQLLRKYGAVSEQVARAMATGGRLSTGNCACISLAITGFAGPTKESELSGLVFVAASLSEGIWVKRHDFASDSRDLVRQNALRAAVSLGLQALLAS